MVLAVADDDAVAVDDQAVGQVEVVGLGLAGLAPGLDQLALGGEAVDAGVAVAVGHIQFAGRRGHQLGGVVEGPGCTGDQFCGNLAAGVGVAAVAAEHLDRLAVEGVDEAGGGVAVGYVDHVVFDVETVGEQEGAVAPGVLQVAVAVEDQDGRLLALEGIDEVLESVAMALTMAKVSPSGSLAQFSWTE